jgi:hypothetical protein
MLRSGPARVAAILLVVMALVATGCRRSRSSGTAPSASAQALPALAAKSWLDVLGSPDAGHPVLALPLGARRARPIVVALPGGDDRPEWACGSYHHVAPEAFVLCLRGIPRESGRYRLGPVEQTRARLRAALPLVKSRYSEHVAPGSVVLAALGPSVDQAVQLALEESSFFSRLVLIDGSLERLSLGVIQRFATTGGQRVLVVCTGTSSCEASAVDRVLALKRGGVDARFVKIEKALGLDGDTTAAIAREWSWLTEDDPRWR